jgi:hypothetical protein
MIHRRNILSFIRSDHPNRKFMPRAVFRVYPTQADAMERYQTAVDNDEVEILTDT